MTGLQVGPPLTLFDWQANQRDQSIIDLRWMPLGTGEGNPLFPDSLWCGCGLCGWFLLKGLVSFLAPKLTSERVPVWRCGGHIYSYIIGLRHHLHNSKTIL